MKKLFINAKAFFSTIIIYAMIGYLIFSLFNIDLSSKSVTDINLLSGLLVITIGLGLVMAGAMANDSGAGGLWTKLFQFVTITYPLVYVIGLISSIFVLYSEMENKQEVARWLASMSLIQLSFIVVLFTISLLFEIYNDRKREKEWEEVKSNKK